MSDSATPFQADAARHALAYAIRGPVIVSSRSDIAAVLQAHRESRGITCLELDDIAGMHQGYVSKLENGGAPSGRQGVLIKPDNVTMSFMAEVWHEALGVALVIMPLDQARAIGAVPAPQREPKVHRGPSLKVGG